MPTKYIRLPDLCYLARELLPFSTAVSEKDSTQQLVADGARQALGLGSSPCCPLDAPYSPLISSPLTPLSVDQGDLLSEVDQLYAVAGFHSAGFLYGRDAALNTPLLKQALTRAALQLPWIAGRLAYDKTASGKSSQVRQKCAYCFRLLPSSCFPPSHITVLYCPVAAVGLLAFARDK